jgi:predicted phage terminase large subunit-like protein
MPKPKAQPEASLALARRSLSAFAAAIEPPDFDATAPHVLAVCRELEAVERGEIRRLVVNLPPRHSKSTLAAILFPIWCLGRSRRRSVIIAAYSDELARDHGRAARDLTLQPVYRAIFGPDACLSDDSQSAGRFSNRAGGSCFYLGAGGPVIGRGADVFVCDDLIRDAIEARSAVAKANVETWFKTSVLTRLAPGGRVVVASTRWAVDDLAGRLLAEDAKAWRLLKLRAVSEEGAPLWPCRYSAEELEATKRAVGSRVWNALYQQEPQSEESLIFKTDWLRFYDSAPTDLSSVVLSLDTAFKTSATADFSAGVVVGKTTGGDFYVLAAWRDRCEFGDLTRKVYELAAAWKPSRTLIEDRASGQSLIQELRRDARISVEPISPRGDKLARAVSVSPIAEAGRLYLPRPGTSAAADALLDELASFPDGAHDDLTDSLTQGLQWLRDAGASWRFLRVGRPAGHSRFDDRGGVPRDFFSKGPQQADEAEDLENEAGWPGGRSAY